MTEKMKPIKTNGNNYDVETDHHNDLKSTSRKDVYLGHIVRRQR